MHSDVLSWSKKDPKLSARVVIGNFIEFERKMGPLGPRCIDRASLCTELRTALHCVLPRHVVA